MPAFRRLILPGVMSTVLLISLAESTTVIPPTFDNLVARASTIFVGTAIEQRALWVNTRRGLAIRTKVSFRVEELWKGSAGPVVDLEFAGGTVGRTTMEVVGMPAFHPGERNVLFVSAERAASPLVGFMHGRMRVDRDAAGIDRVRTNEGQPLANVNEMGPLRRPHTRPVMPMRLSDLAAAVHSRLTGAAR